MTLELMPLSDCLLVVDEWHTYGACEGSGEHSPSCTLAAEVERLAGEDQSGTIATLNADVEGLAGELTRLRSAVLAAQVYRTAIENSEPAGDAWALLVDALDALGAQ